MKISPWLLSTNVYVKGIVTFLRLIRVFGGHFALEYAIVEKNVGLGSFCYASLSSIFVSCCRLVANFHIVWLYQKYLIKRQCSRWCPYLSSCKHNSICVSLIFCSSYTFFYPFPETMCEMLLTQVLSPDYNTFIYNEKTRCYWFADNASENLSDLFLVGVVSLTWISYTMKLFFAFGYWYLSAVFIK